MIPLSRPQPPASGPGGTQARLLIGAALLLLAPLCLISVPGASQEVSAGGHQVEAFGPRHTRRHHRQAPVAVHYPSAFAPSSRQPRHVQRVINDAPRQVIQSEWRGDAISASIRRRRRHRPHPLRTQRPMRADDHRVQESQQQQQPQLQRESSTLIEGWPQMEASSNSSGEPTSMINLIRRPRHHTQPAGNSSAAARKQQTTNGGFSRRLQQLRQKYRTNQAISGTPYYVLLVIYASLITFGTISNFLICLTVILKPKILSPRNIFIVNLAGSDLLLCVFTMPFSFIELSMKMWQLGKITCKLVAGLQATSIFVSTISITAIAIDRYKVIVYPTHKETASGARGAALLVGSVWIGALALSSPLFGYRTVERMNELIHDRPSERIGSGALSNSSASLADDYQNNNGSTIGAPSSSSQQLLGAPSSQEAVPELIEFCVERWPFAHGRGLYSVISMIFQYVLPITIVSVVYTQISRKLQKRLIRRQRLTQLECQQKRQLNLIRRTHTMLICVSLVFGLSWLPLNLLNVVSDFSPRLLQLLDDQSFRVIFAACHLIGCSSACSNPILYAFLNENFRKEFRQVYDQHARHVGHLLRRLCCCQPPEDATTRLDYELRRGSATKQLEPPALTTCGDAPPGANLQIAHLQTHSDDDHDDSTASGFSTSDTGNSSMSGSLDDHDRQSTGSSSSQAPLARDVSVVSGRNHSSLVNLGASTAGHGATLEIFKSTRSLATAGGRQPSLLAPPDRLANMQQDESGSSRQRAGSTESRKLSFQTVTSSGRRTVSKTLRFCLCLSDSSLSSNGPQSANNKRRSMIKLARLTQANGAPPTPSEIERRASGRKRRRARRRRRRLRQQLLQLECECQCHKRPLEANEEVIKSGACAPEVPEKQRTADAEQMAVRRASREQTRRANAAVGRRVWLRFLSGLASQDHAIEAQDKSCDNGSVKDRGETQAAIELATGTWPTYEIKEAAPGEPAPVAGEKVAAKRAHCNNCKHTSGPRSRLSSADRGSSRQRTDSRKQQSRSKEGPLNKVPLLKTPIHDGAARSTFIERHRRHFQLPKWISFSRSSSSERDSASAPGKRLAATKSLAGKVNGLASTGKQNSSTSSFGADASKLGRALRQTNSNWSADERATVASSRSPDRSALGSTVREQSVRKSGSSSSRLAAASSTVDQLQQSAARAAPTAIATANKGVNSAAGKKVGTVYLSIETGERSRGDSMVSLSCEKSTSVVVIGAEDEEGPARALEPVAADRPASALGWDYRGAKLDGIAGQWRRASNDDAQINDETNNLRSLSAGTRLCPQPGANQCLDNESTAGPPASQSEARAAPRIQLCNAHQQQPSTDIDAGAEAAPEASSQLNGELHSSSASSSSYMLSAAASSGHSSSCTCSSASTSSSCQWAASQPQHQDKYNRASTYQEAANQTGAYEAPESREQSKCGPAAQTSGTANVITRKSAPEQHQSHMLVTSDADYSASRNFAAGGRGELSSQPTARPHHHSVRLGHQTARTMQPLATSSTEDPIDTTNIGLRGHRTYSATTENEALSSAKRVAVAASAAYRAGQRTSVGADAMKSRCSGSLATLGFGASGSARPSLCDQNRSAAHLNERSTATTCGTTCGTATTASSCSLFTTTTTSRSSLSGELCGPAEDSVDFDACQASGGASNATSSERPNRNKVCQQPTSGGSSAPKPAPELEQTAPSLA